VFGFKCFLVDSGVPEFPPLDRAGLDLALSTVDTLFIVHAEDPHQIQVAASSRRYADFVASRPPAAEDAAIASTVDAAVRTGARVHILHLSAASALPAIARARAGDGCEAYPRERTVVIGDTPRDIACARADRLRVAAVATGPFAVEALADADAVADDARALLPVLEDFAAWHPSQVSGC
jgi:hypothetical protein